MTERNPVGDSPRNGLRNRVAARFHAHRERFREQSRCVPERSLGFGLAACCCACACWAWRCLAPRAVPMTAPAAAYSLRSSSARSPMIAPFAAPRTAPRPAGAPPPAAGPAVDLNAGHRIGRVDAGALARPGMTFAFVFGDTGWRLDPRRDRRRDPATPTRFAPRQRRRSESARQQGPTFEASDMTEYLIEVER